MVISREGDGIKNQIEKLISSLNFKDKLIDEEQNEKRDLLVENIELNKKKDRLQAQISENVKENANLHEDLEMAKAELEKLKKENEKCKDQSRDEKENAAKLMKMTGEIVGPLQNHIREQEAQIKALQKEVNTLRNVTLDYQKDIDVVRTQVHRYQPPIVSKQDMPHMSLFDETNWQQLPAPTTSSQIPHTTPNVLKELERTRERLESSNKRVTQLERWLDEIYNNKQFDVVSKNIQDANKGNTPYVSLPPLVDHPNDQIKRPYVTKHKSS